MSDDRSKEYVTIKIHRETRRLAKFLATVLDEPMLALIHRLILEEYKRRTIEQPDHYDHS